MKIHAHIANPVLHKNDDLLELTQKVKEIDPLLDSITIMPTRVTITRIARRTFPFGPNPSIDWIVAKVKYMANNNL